jgi:hypothetical protein
LRVRRQEGNSCPQRNVSFEGWVDAGRFDSQERGLASSIRTIGEDFDRVGGKAGGEILQRFFVTHSSLTKREQRGQKNGDKAGRGQQAGVPLGANIRAIEFVFRTIVQGSSEFKDGFVKAWLAQAQRGCGVAPPSKIKEQRLLRKGTKKAGWKSGGVLGRERGRGRIPRQGARGQNNQDVRWPVSAIQYSASFSTQGEPAASGEARRMKNND